MRALDEGPSAADVARGALDRAAPTQREPFQVGTRVSTLASVFDSKFGVSWSRATFGAGGVEGSPASAAQAAQMPALFEQLSSDRAELVVKLHLERHAVPL